MVAYVSMSVVVASVPFSHVIGLISFPEVVAFSVRVFEVLPFLLECLSVAFSV